MSVSLIIPYHSGSFYLDACFASLVKDLDNIAEVIVVSNGNASSQRIPSDYDGLVRVLQHDEPLGYPAAINLGAKEAQSPLLVFCDADTFFPQAGWIAKHCGLRDSRPEIGITSSKLLNYRTDRILDFGIGRTRFNNFHPYLDSLKSDQRIQQSRRVQMACSAVMTIERDLFRIVGGFDESLRYYYQDLDLSLRLKKAQREVWVVADAVAYHRSQSSSITRAPFQIDERGYFTLKNSELFDIDYPRYLIEALTPYATGLSSSGPFALVNLSTLIDLNEVLPLIHNYTSTKDLCRWTPPSRDLQFIALPDVVQTKALRYKGPLLIVVDRAFSLRFNALWRFARDTRADLVVDRHANAYLFDEIVEIQLESSCP